MKTWITPTAVTALTLVAAAAHATPAVEPKCSRRVIHPPQGTGVHFDEDCSTTYIKPPTTGVAEVGALSQNLNLNFCPALVRIGDTTDRVLDSTELIADQLVLMIESFAPLAEDLEAAQLRSAEARAERELSDEVLFDAEGQAEDLRDALRGAQDAYNDCVLFDGASACGSFELAVGEAREEFREFLATTLRPAQSAARVAARDVRVATAHETAISSRYGEGLEPLLALQQRLFDLNTSMFDVYTDYAPLEGATGQLVYSVPWDTLLTDYQALNPRLNLQPLPIKDAVFTAVAKFRPSVSSSLPAVLEASLPGARARGPLRLPTGLGAIRLGTEAPVSGLSERTIGFGTSLSGQVILSLLGACPYFPQGVDTSPGAQSEIDLDQLSANMVANVEYSYELKARRGYTATYNLSSWASRIEKKVKKGGFLSSKSIHEVVTDQDSSDWFDIEFDQTSGQFGYSPAEQTRLQTEVQGQLTERALKLIAVQDGTLSGAPSSATLTPTGAGAAAGYLSRGCGFWVWCRVGGFFLGTLDSLFGRSTALSTFKKNNEATVTDRVSQVTVIDASGSITFAPEE